MAIAFRYRLRRVSLLALAFAVLTWLLVTSARVGSSAPATLCVNPGGTGGCFSKIADAINAASSGDTINVAAGTYTENLNIAKDLTIIGAGANQTIVDGNQAGRVVYLSSGTATLAQMTLRNGKTIGSAGGVVILSGAGMTLTHTIVSGNGAGADGGGIFNSGALTVLNSTVMSNTTTDFGGGMYNANTGTLTISNSTLSGNTAALGGGGLGNYGTATVTNSTISGNNTPQGGGGIYNSSSGTVRFFNATITQNQADSDYNGTGKAGGLFNSSGTARFRNTILAGNSDTLYDPSLMIWISHTSECAGVMNSDDLLLLQNYNTSICTLVGGYLLTDPKLGALADNGGVTQTHALLSGSPAIDSGALNKCPDPLGNPLAADQRGFPRPADGAGTYRCDIGAFELQRLVFLPLVVR